MISCQFRLIRNNLIDREQISRGKETPVIKGMQLLETIPNKIDNKLNNKVNSYNTFKKTIKEISQKNQSICLPLITVITTKLLQLKENYKFETNCSKSKKNLLKIIKCITVNKKSRFNYQVIRYFVNLYMNKTLLLFLTLKLKRLIFTTIVVSIRKAKYTPQISNQ